MNKNFRHGNSAALMNQEISQNPASRMGYQSKPKGRAMSEAPKKIWMVEETCWLNHDQPSGDIPYIRADIVDELVEAVEEVLRISDRKHDAWDKTKAALAKLEESHDR